MKDWDPIGITVSQLQFYQLECGRDISSNQFTYVSRFPGAGTPMPTKAPWLSIHPSGGWCQPVSRKEFLLSVYSGSPWQGSVLAQTSVVELSPSRGKFQSWSNLFDQVVTYLVTFLKAHVGRGSEQKLKFSFCYRAYCLLALKKIGCFLQIHSSTEHHKKNI